MYQFLDPATPKKSRICANLMGRPVGGWGRGSGPPGPSPRSLVPLIVAASPVCLAQFRAPICRGFPWTVEPAWSNQAKVRGGRYAEVVFLWCISLELVLLSAQNLIAEVEKGRKNCNMWLLVWLNGLVVSTLGIWVRGLWFNSRVAPLFYWLATLGKLFTHIASPVSQLHENVVMVIKCIARLS